MQIKLPAPFTFEAGPRAVLLLHGFTGNSADVRMLGRFLEKHGYTSYAPIYRGHGKEPEALLDYRPEDWWEDAQKAYDHLQDLGYKEIAVVGLSLGGALALRLASCRQVKGVVPMCTPVLCDQLDKLIWAYSYYARQYKQLEGKAEETVEEEVKLLLEASKPLFEAIGPFIEDTLSFVELIYTPAFVVQARKDEIINPESAQLIYEKLESIDKNLKWYENSPHVITTGPERNQLHEDVLQFLNGLDWEE